MENADRVTALNLRAELLTDLYRGDQVYLRKRLQALFREASCPQSRLPLALLFDLALTEEDQKFLVERGIVP